MPAKPPTSRGRLGELLSPEFMARLDALDVFSRKILQSRPQGQRRSKRRGQSIEFADHRRYVAGDDLRFVDWNIYGRLGQLFLKLFLEEQDLTVHILVDASESMAFGDPAKSLSAARLAAALGYVSLVNNNRLTVSTFADGIVGQQANMRGRGELNRLVELLLALECAGQSRFERSCRQAATMRTGTGLMIVLSDFLFKEGYDAGIRRLIGRQYDLYALQILSPQELSPEFGGDLRLVDVEDGNEAEVTVSGALLDYYKRNLRAYCGELKQFCRRRGATFVQACSADPVESLVLNYLRRVGLLR